MPWDVKFNKAEGEYDCFLNGVRKATIRKQNGYASPWLVTRITVSLSGKETLGGVDSFKTLVSAMNFVTKNPTVWGG